MKVLDLEMIKFGTVPEKKHSAAPVKVEKLTLKYNKSLYTGWWFGTFFIFPYIGNNHPS